MFYVLDTTSGGYYTGRAGDWSNVLSADLSEAFGYESEEGAQRRADTLNKGRLLHGKRFEVVCA
jgi:hypothetical protein